MGGSSRLAAAPVTPGTIFPLCGALGLGMADTGTGLAVALAADAVAADGIARPSNRQQAPADTMTRRRSCTCN
jgi:hypothetical protein